MSEPGTAVDADSGAPEPARPIRTKNAGRVAVVRPMAASAPPPTPSTTSPSGSTTSPSGSTTSAAPPSTEPAKTASSASVTGAGPEQSRGMRHRLARLGSSRPQTPVLDPLFRVLRANHPKADVGLIEKAYKTAERHHRGQMRASGDAYITHPLAVATILAELGMTESTLCAALLHDTVEDTPYTLTQLSKDFGEEIAAARRRCDEARQGQVRRHGQVGDHPQDGHRDEPRHPGPGHQAGRPAAQHAYAALPAARQAVADRERDTRDLRSAGSSARHEHRQVGAGGPVVRHHPPQDLRRDRAAGRRGGAEPQRLPRRRDRAGAGGSEGGQAPGHRHRPAEALLLDLSEDGRPRP